MVEVEVAHPSLLGQVAEGGQDGLMREQEHQEVWEVVVGVELSFVVGGLEEEEVVV